MGECPECGCCCAGACCPSPVGIPLHSQDKIGMACAEEDSEEEVDVFEEDDPILPPPVGHPHHLPLPLHLNVDRDGMNTVDTDNIDMKTPQPPLPPPSEPPPPPMLPVPFIRCVKKGMDIVDTDDIDKKKPQPPLPPPSEPPPRLLELPVRFIRCDKNSMHTVDPDNISKTKPMPPLPPPLNEPPLLLPVPEPSRCDKKDVGTDKGEGKKKLPAFQRGLKRKLSPVDISD